MVIDLWRIGRCAVAKEIVKNPAVGRKNMRLLSVLAEFKCKSKEVLFFDILYHWIYIQLLQIQVNYS
jgi:hypothetical protein